MSEIITRRGLITGLGALFIAAPAIVRATSIMPVKALDIDLSIEGGLYGGDLYGDLAAVTRKVFVPRIFVQLWKSTPMPDEFIHAG